jgi:SAM-dependent methyltransferase
VSLVDVDLFHVPAPLPGDVSDLLQAADQRIAQFLEDQRERVVPGFVPSDFVRVYEALRAIRHSDLPAGNLFCEWGSGLGIVAMLAAKVGFSACGIELEAELVEGARGLAEELGVQVEFVCGTLIPAGGEVFADRAVESAWLGMGGADAYEELELDACDFDVIFAYPWPGDERVIEDLFEHYAAAGALLLTFHGMEDLRLRRKVAQSTRAT